GNGENKSHGFRATERPARHSRHQRVEQISENHGDRYGDQDRLQEANDVGRGPDRCADNDDEKNHEAGGQCRPHGLTLRWRGMLLDWELRVGRWTLDICRAAVHKPLRCLMFALTTSDLFLQASPCQLFSSFLRFCPQDFCFLDPVPALSAMIPMPPEHDSISNTCHQYVR